jgi:V/A-type H+-transporting ATPase subunit E
MGCEELIESLRKEAEAKTREIWKEAEEEAGKIKAAVSLRLEAPERDNAAERASEEGARKVLLEAETRARMIRLTSEDSLSARLYSLASASLGLLRGERYEDIFGRLVMELPSAGWQRVRVNPDDSGLAKKSFPGAEIVADKNIAGGMETEAEEGSVRVVNTFEKRLERSWPQMLPDLLADIYREVMDSGTPPKS